MVGGGITYEKRQCNSSPFLSVSISSFWPCVKRRRCCEEVTNGLLFFVFRGGDFDARFVKKPEFSTRGGGCIERPKMLPAMDWEGGYFGQ